MATEVTAWRANDGTLHDSRCDAATNDLTAFVMASPMAENQPYARQLVEWLTKEAGQIVAILTEYREACPIPPQEGTPSESSEGTLERTQEGPRPADEISGDMS